VAKLTVNAIAEDAVAAPGNANTLHMVVSVEDQNGTPVTGLAVMGNFALGSELVALGGSLSQIGGGGNGQSPGVYILKVVPPTGQTWKAGVYIFSVAVTRGADHGLALCSVLMD